MPALIPPDLPAYERLRQENIPVIAKESQKAKIKQLPRLNFLILNLMPTKIKTECQLIRLLSSTSYVVNVDLLHPASYKPKNVDSAHMEKFYTSFAEIEAENFDGLIITGAPVEHLEFEEVDYWRELQQIIDWSYENIISTLFICWGAQAALYHHYGIDKHPLDNKLFGVFSHQIRDKNEPLLQGFNDEILIPHSRHTRVKIEDIEEHQELKKLIYSDKAGLHLAARRDKRQIFQTGHFEYDADTLQQEYKRDRHKGLDIKIPENYFPDDDPGQKPRLKWRAHGQLFYNNWLDLIHARKNAGLLSQISG